jgi:hypothetical protein
MQEVVTIVPGVDRTHDQYAITLDPAVSLI